MNFLALAFYEKVAIDLHVSTLTAGANLAGLIGAVCSEFLDRKAFHAIQLSNNSAKSSFRSFFKMANGWHAEIESTSRKHLHQTTIYLDTHRPIDPAVSNQFPDFCKRSNVFLWLDTSTLSKQIIEFAGSIPIVSSLIIATIVTETIEKIMEKMVEKKTLTCLDFRTEHRLSAATTEALLDLLKQEQFNEVFLWNNCDLPLESVIAEWREHSDEMAGKVIKVMESTVITNPIGDFGFEQCTEEEVDYMYRYHSQRPWTRAQRVFILRHENGRSMYVLRSFVLQSDDGWFYRNAILFS